MKSFLILLTAGWLLYPITNHGSETAQARLYCMSLRFQQGTISGGTLNISTIGGTSYNGELMPTYLSDASGNPWGSGLALVWSGYTDGGSIYVNLPLGVDANNDGYDDFFEVSQGVNNAVTSGTYSTGTYFSGTVTATWNRAAGSASGTCMLHLYDNLWGNLGNFTCPFTLLEYTGPLTYTPGSNTVSAAVNLTQTGNPANTLKGPIVFVKSSTDRFNTLTNQPGVWTNASLQTLSFDSESFIAGHSDLAHQLCRLRLLCRWRSQHGQPGLRTAGCFLLTIRTMPTPTAYRISATIRPACRRRARRIFLSRLAQPICC